MNILLASNSPRRKELLQNLGFEFSVVSIDCEESFPPSLPSSEVAGFLSLLKSNAYLDLKQDEILITADTVVELDQQILGKPETKEKAFEMLRSLSGKIHHVYTGITIRTCNQTITETDVAKVVFNDITDSEILHYIEKSQPFDKAGSYGIQEWIGMAKIRKIEGSFYTIMGLPTHLVYEMLNRIR